MGLPLRRATLALALFFISNVLCAEFIINEEYLLECQYESGGCRWDSTKLWHENKFPGSFEAQPGPEDSVTFDLTKHGDSSSKYYIFVDSEVTLLSLKVLTAVSRSPTSASDLTVEITKQMDLKTLEISGFFSSVILNSTLKASTLSICDGGSLAGGLLTTLLADRVRVSTHGVMTIREIQCSEINISGASGRFARGAVDRLTLSEGSLSFEAGSIDIKSIVSASGKIESHVDSVIHRLETLHANKTALQLRGRMSSAFSGAQIQFYESNGAFCLPSGSFLTVYAHGSKLALSVHSQRDELSEVSIIAHHSTQIALETALKSNITVSDGSTVSILPNLASLETGITFADSTGTFHVAGSPLFQRNINLNQTKLIYVVSTSILSSEPSVVLNASFYTGKFSKVVEIEQGGVLSTPPTEIEYKEHSVLLRVFLSPVASGPSTRSVVALLGFILVFLLIFGGIIATFFAKYHRKCRERAAVVAYAPVVGQEDRYS